MVFVPGGDKPSKDELEKELGDYKLKLTEEADKICAWVELPEHFPLGSSCTITFTYSQQYGSTMGDIRYIREEGVFRDLS